MSFKDIFYRLLKVWRDEEEASRMKVSFLSWIKNTAVEGFDIKLYHNDESGTFVLLNTKEDNVPLNPKYRYRFAYVMKNTDLSVEEISWFVAFSKGLATLKGHLEPSVEKGLDSKAALKSMFGE